MAAVKHVVVDSGGFIRNAPLKDIGENIYTIREVVGEIRDKATRQRLQVLPYSLKFRDPSPEAIRIVTDFSKKTGDYRSLSAVDIRVLALVYELEKEHVGTQHVKELPDRNVAWETAKKPLQNPTEIVGFYLSTKGKEKNYESDSHCSSDAVPITQDVKDLDLCEAGSFSVEESTNIKATEKEQTLSCEDNLIQSNNKETIESSGENPIDKTSSDIVLKLPEQHEVCVSDQDTDACVRSDITNSSEEVTALQIPKTSGSPDSSEEGGGEDMSETRVLEESREKVGDGDILPEDCLEDGGGSSSGEGESEEESESDEEDDGGGWITPSNIKQVKASIGDVNTQKAEVVVGCITTDFSMQMGLNVVSVDGMLIKRAKTYVLRCFACFKISTDMTREFCFHCGNQTLKKVSMTVEEDGSIKYFLSTRKPPTTRGMRFSLPTPKGGKHAQNPILVEDQKEAQQRGSKHSKVKYNVFDADYVTHTSPFAPTDIYSRAAQLGIRGQRGQKKRRGNPNENRKVYGRRK